MSTTVEPPFRASRYTTGAIVLHWTIALLILLQIAGGFVMTDLLAAGSTLQFNAYQVHKSLGISVLVLTVARVLWRVFNPPPPEPASVSRLEAAVAHTVHFLFYAALLVIPLSGWLLVTVSPVQVETVLFFQDWLPWPHLPGFEGLSSTAREGVTHWTEVVHAWLAYGTGALVALHVAGAVKHHLADGRYIARMSPRAPGDGPRNSYGHATTTVVTVVFLGAMVAAGTLARMPASGETDLAGVSPDQPRVLATAAEPAQKPDAPESAQPPGGAATDGAAAASEDGRAPLWTIDKAASRLTFTFDFSGDRVTGRFDEWSADVRFDPDNLEGSSITVRIATPSAELDSDDVSKAQLSGEDGFADDAHGTATFEADTIRRAEGAGYVADGTLTIRGESVPQSLAFTVDIEGDSATARGSVTVDRLDYGIGAENDPGADWVSREVTIEVAVEATRAGGAVAGGAEVDAGPAKAAADTGERAGQAAGPAPQWTLLPEPSSVTFSFGFEGDEVTGAIEAFATDIRFDPHNLAGSSIYASLDLATATIEGDAISSAQLKGADGLDVDDERLARFEADTIRRAGEDSYEADGTLELRGVRVPLTLPFSLFIVEGRAVAEGTVSLDRLAFGVGEENDPNATMIDPEVDVRLRIVAVSAEARPDFGR